MAFYHGPITEPWEVQKRIMIDRWDVQRVGWDDRESDMPDGDSEIYYDVNSLEAAKMLAEDLNQLDQMRYLMSTMGILAEPIPGGSEGFSPHGTTHVIWLEPELKAEILKVQLGEVPKLIPKSRAAAICREAANEHTNPITRNDLEMIATLIEQDPPKIL